MFTSFTGTSRKPRQVNLSGRNANPFTFANPSYRTSQQSSGPQSTVASAQQERLARQHERERLASAKKVQRVWRGHRCRRKLKEEWRREWDAFEVIHGLRVDAGDLEKFFSDASDYSKASIPEYGSIDDVLSQMQRICGFVTINHSDLARFDYFAVRVVRLIQIDGEILSRAVSRSIYHKFVLLVLRIIQFRAEHSPVGFQQLVSNLTLLFHTTRTVPQYVASQSKAYYSAIAKTLTTLPSLSLEDQDRLLNGFLPGFSKNNSLLQILLCPLESIHRDTANAYEGFSLGLLTTNDLADFPVLLQQITNNINYLLLARAVRTVLRGKGTVQSRGTLSTFRRMWLLSYLIYIHQSAYITKSFSNHFPEPDFVASISILLGSLSDEISQRIDLTSPPSPSALIFEADPRTKQRPLPDFVRTQIVSLVDQKSISSLLGYVLRPQSPSTEERVIDEAGNLASYALTLLRVFYRRGEDIRMWLYLGSITDSASTTLNSGGTKSAIKYFWNATQRTSVFTSISRDHRAAISLLKSSGNVEDSLDHKSAKDTAEEWKIVLLFFELYSFVLKVTDDEEFFSGSLHHSLNTINGSSSWAREGTISLQHVKELTGFLKNLAFTMYWNTSEILGTNRAEAKTSLSHWFKVSSNHNVETEEPKTSNSLSEIGIAGVTGMTLEYIKGTVTGLLRMIYERDSRRRFLPKGHWLMTARFDMEGFISAVVAEEENRHQIEDADEEDDEEHNLSEQQHQASAGLIGTSRVQQTRNREALQWQQRKLSRKRYLEIVTPRLEILQNMPFFIPFETRVHIFREFISMDQMRRRKGHIDPDNWRMAVIHEGSSPFVPRGHGHGHEVISRHHAEVRRESIFNDAMQQFYPLGDGLKEPIQITFIDKFNTAEAGIDGGGVTKEFLTSVTHEALNSMNGYRFFVQNDKNLLYPNPSAVDEEQDRLRREGYEEGSVEWNKEIRELLKKFQFLGRVIGKCLYEGILVDAGFAGFFLLKWALTGGIGAASKESGYRANLNDLRDLDESLYQGLLQLKNYPGNVEDFSLNFTITDNVYNPDATGGDVEHSKTITRELKPGGSNIAVTNENRLLYISLVARHRLQTQPRLQTNAFLRGLGEIIQPSWLSMFNQNELQTLVGGDSSDIDIADLRANTQYGGVYVIGDDGQEHPSVQLFWQVMRALSERERRQVLKFVTSTPRAPLLGFRQLNPRFSIRDAGDDQERLPSTSTCVNLLKLPRYASAEVLRQKLLYAVQSGAGFDLS